MPHVLVDVPITRRYQLIHSISPKTSRYATAFTGGAGPDILLVAMCFPTVSTILSPKDCVDANDRFHPYFPSREAATVLYNALTANLPE